jgi:DNA polymerase-4
VFARTVVLKVKLGRRVKSGPRGYPLLTRRITLREPSDDGLVFSQAATGLLDKLTPLEPVRLIGVGVTNLLELDPGQLSLLGARAGAAERAQLNRALDEIRDRFGSAAIARGGSPEAERAGLSMQIKRGEG